MSNVIRFEERTLSYRLGYAMFWANVTFEERQAINTALSDLPSDAQETDFPEPIRDLLAWAERMADEKQVSDRPPTSKSLQTKSKRFIRKFEPYNPDAADGDGDGIVQDGTPWERPAGARVLDAANREIRRGLNSPTRPAGARIVDADGKPLDYTPSWAGGDGDTNPNVVSTAPPATPLDAPITPAEQPKTPLSDHGARTLKERGFRSVQDTITPKPPPVKKAAKEKPVKDEGVKKPVVSDGAAVKPKRRLLSRKPKESGPDPLLEGGDVPGHNDVAVDRPELVEPTKPRSPYTPAPPPLSGRAQELADEADGDFAKFMELLDSEGYVVFDYETTGLQDGNIPVQIGAVRIKDGQIVERFNVFVNPERGLSDWSKANLKNVDGEPLTDDWLANQQSLSAAHQQLADFMGDSIIVAHNLPYDGEIIEREMANAGIEHNPSGSIDTLSLIRSAVPKSDDTVTSHGLGALARFFDVELGDGAHTADADSEAAAGVLQRAMQWAANNDSSPDIFDAVKQAELYEAAQQKYLQQHKQYEKDLAKYRLDLDEYQRAVAKANDPSVPEPPEHRYKPAATKPRSRDEVVAYLLDNADEIRTAVVDLTDLTGDRILRVLYARQGFDAAPNVVDSPDDLPQGRPLYRGLGDGDEVTYEQAVAWAEQFRTGDHYPGVGVYGAGTYTSTMREKVQRIYGHRKDRKAKKPRTLLHMSASYDADILPVTQYETELEATMFAVRSKLQELRDADDAEQYDKYKFLLRVVQDPGRIAALMGYDGYESNYSDVVILNRSALSVVRDHLAPRR